VHVGEHILPCAQLRDCSWINNQTTLQLIRFSIQQLFESTSCTFWLNNQVLIYESINIGITLLLILSFVALFLSDLTYFWITYHQVLVVFESLYCSFCWMTCICCYWFTCLPLETWLLLPWPWWWFSLYLLTIESINIWITIMAHDGCSLTYCLWFLYHRSSLPGWGTTTLVDSVTSLRGILPGEYRKGGPLPKGGGGREVPKLEPFKEVQEVYP
jgi:hypothetical protein